MDWNWRDRAEGEKLFSEGGEVRGVVEGEVVFFAIPV